MKPSLDQAVQTYFHAWSSRDASILREALDPAVEVVGPLGTIHGAEQYMRDLGQIFGITRRIEIVKRWVDGPDTLTWFDLHHTQGPDSVPVANWVHTQNGLITRVRIAFDAAAVFGKDHS